MEQLQKTIEVLEKRLESFKQEIKTADKQGMFSEYVILNCSIVDTKEDIATLKRALRLITYIKGE